MRESEEEVEEMVAIPPLFRCPISLGLLRDPVTLCTGQTYERTSIEKWLSAGNTTCPVTMQKLHDRSIVPNHTLRHLIRDWLRLQAPLFCHDLFADHVDGLDVSAMKQSLKSESSEQRIQTLERIQALSEDLPFHNSALIEWDMFGVILEVVFGDSEEVDVGFAEVALSTALKLLPFSDLGSINMLKNRELGFARFSTLFECDSFVIKKILYRFIEAVASSSETRDLCKMLGKSSRVLRQLIGLVININDDVSLAAIKAISALASLEPNCESMVRKGVIDPLITCILANAHKRKTNLAPTAMRALELLLVSEQAKDAIIHHPEGLNAIVKMVFRVSDHEGSDSAVNCLIIVCSDSLHAREVAICGGVLTQLLLLLQSQCCGRTKARARMLLKLLRSMWSDDPKHAV